MATTYTAGAGLAKPAAADRNWNVPLNANVDLLDGFAAVGSLCGAPNEVPSASLTLRVSACSFVAADNSVSAYAGGTIALDASSTACVWLTAAGVLTKGAAFPSTPHVRCCVATTGTAAITAIVDARYPHPLVGA